VVRSDSLVSVIVPTWNERDNIRALLASVRHALDGVDYEVVVVDDASPDGTGTAVKGDARHHPNIRLVQRAGKMGLSSAVMEGAAQSAGSIVVMMDADFSHDPNLLPLLIERVRSGSDVAIGSRYVPGARLEGWPIHRRIGSTALTEFARAVFRLRVHDPLSGFAAFRRQVLEDVPTRFSVKGFKLLLEVLATQPSLRVCELPISFVDRTRGTSKLGVREMREFVMLCYRLMRWRRASASAHDIRRTTSVLKTPARTTGRRPHASQNGTSATQRFPGL
jgi:dolichol-phosphate mannosyltransferase